MSLLNRGNEDVVVFPEETYTDQWGNTQPRTSETGIPCRAVVQPLGTPTEKLSEGFYTRSKFRLRLIGYRDELGGQSHIEWDGRRYSIEGGANRYNGSPQTRRLTYVMVRS
jgi:hypothetical protein